MPKPWTLHRVAYINKSVGFGIPGVGLKVLRKDCLDSELRVRGFGVWGLELRVWVSRVEGFMFAYQDAPPPLTKLFQEGFQDSFEVFWVG